MTTFLYDDEMLLRYLLGTASETETTRLDELSLTDEACALALAQTENDLVDDYARDGLGAVEYAQFERHYLATLLRREKAHFALALQRLGQQAAAPSTANKTARLPLSARFAWLWPPTLWQWGLAATALVLLAAGGWLIAENQRWQQQARTERAALLTRERELQSSWAAETSAQAELARVRERLAQMEAQQAAHSILPAPSTVAPAAQLFTFALAAPTRGTARLPTLNFPPRISVVAVRLELETSVYPRYRVALRDLLTNRVLWQSGKLAAVRSKTGATVTARLPARLFAKQRYAFELSGLTADNAEERLSSYPFTVVTMVTVARP